MAQVSNWGHDAGPFLLSLTIGVSVVVVPAFAPNRLHPKYAVRSWCSDLFR